MEIDKRCKKCGSKQIDYLAFAGTDQFYLCRDCCNQSNKVSFETEKCSRCEKPGIICTIDSSPDHFNLCSECKIHIHELNLICYVCKKDRKSLAENHSFKLISTVIEKGDNNKTHVLPHCSMDCIRQTKKQMVNYTQTAGYDKVISAVCGFCGKTQLSMKKCSACRGIYYCSIECQKANWPQHKKICKTI